MPAIDDLREFNVQGSDIALWVFKKSYPNGATAAPRFKGRWVQTTDALDVVLKQTVIAEIGRIEEVTEYGLLAQNNEASALSIGTLETHAGLVVDEAAEELPNKKVTVVKDIRNTDFYVIKLVQNDDVIFAVKKVDQSWGTKRAVNAVAVLFNEQQLTVDERPSFDIARSVDFFIVNDTVLIANKARFESILSYKEAHKHDFADLQQDADFVAIFTNLAPLVTFVGENKIQLRRAAAIRQKGHFRNAGFIANLRNSHAANGLDIQFDAANRIVPTAETCRDIFQALLDHRLSSPFSSIVYDVPDAVAV